MTTLSPRPSLAPSPHLRGIAVLTVAGVVIAFVWGMAGASKGWRAVFVIAFAVVAVWGWKRFTKERAILGDCASAIGTVTAFTKTDSEGSYYEITYEFTTSDSTFHAGSCSSSNELPEKGELVEILYRSKKPETNMPREVFWFYGW